MSNNLWIPLIDPEGKCFVEYLPQDEGTFQFTVADLEEQPAYLFIESGWFKLPGLMEGCGTFGIVFDAWDDRMADKDGKTYCEFAPEDNLIYYSWLTGEKFLQVIAYRVNEIKPFAGNSLNRRRIDMKMWAQSAFSNAYHVAINDYN